MNMWEGMEADRRHEIARDAVARADSRPPLPVGRVVRAHMLAGAVYLVLLVVGIAGWLWWAGPGEADDAWLTWAIIVGVAGFGVPLLTVQSVGDVLEEGRPGRLGLGLAWLLIVVATVAAVLIPTMLLGPRLATPMPLDGDPLKIALACLTPLVGTLLLITVLLQLWQLPLLVNGAISVLLILLATTVMLPLPWTARGDAPAWVEAAAVSGGIVLLPFAVIGMLLLPIHRVAAVSDYSG